MYEIFIIMRYLLLVLSILLFSTNLLAGVSGLMVAVEEGNLSEVQKQLASGADINFQDANGNTALIRATNAGNEQIAKYLVKNGADTQIKNNAGYSALDVAKANKFTQIAEILKSGETAISTGSPAIADTATATGSSSAATAGATAPAAGATGAGISTGILVAGGIAVVGGGVALAVGGGGGSSNGTSNNPQAPGSDLAGIHPKNDSALPYITTEAAYIGSNVAFNNQYALARGYDGSIYNRDANGYLIDNQADGFVKVAVVDGGIRLTHNELNDNILASEAVNCTSSGCVSGIAIPDDHGTFVAGIIAGERNGTGIHGVAPKAKLVSVDTFQGSSSTSSNVLSWGLKFASDSNAKVINNSWGSMGVFSSIKPELLRTTFNDLNTNNGISDGIAKNQIFVWASGNASDLNASVQSNLPLIYDGTPDSDNGFSSLDLRGLWITTTATYFNGSNYNLASYANKCGAAKDWCLAGVGGDTGSLVTSIAETGDNDLASGRGTSYAAPAVTGAVASMIGAFPHLSAKTITQILFDTATDLGVAGVDDVFGHGLVNLQKATDPSDGGWTLATGAKTFSLASTSFDVSRLSLGSGFGDALKNSNLKLQFFDSYYKNYTIGLNSLVNTNKNLSYQPEELLQNYGENRFENNQALFNGVENSLNFSYSVGTKDTVRNQMKSEFDREAKFDKFSLSHSLKLSEDRSISSTLSVNENAANVISTKALEQVNNENSFISAQTFKNPYLNLAEESKTVAQTLTNGKFGFGFGAFDGSLAKETSSRFTQNNGIRGFAGDASYKVGEDSTLSLQSGLTEEQNSFLGSSSGGAFSTGDKTKTFFGAVATKIGITDRFSLVGNYNLGWTDLNIAENSFFKNFSVAKSNSFAVGGNYKGVVNDKDSFGLTFSQPLRVYNAKVDLSLPVGIKQDGDVVYSNSRTSLTPQGQERNFEGSYSYKLNDKESLSFGSLLRLEPDNIKDAKSEVILMGRYRVEF